jgi:hypothetical protein
MEEKSTVVQFCANGTKEIQLTTHRLARRESWLCEGRSFPSLSRSDGPSYYWPAPTPRFTQTSTPSRLHIPDL